MPCPIVNMLWRDPINMLLLPRTSGQNGLVATTSLQQPTTFGTWPCSRHCKSFPNSFFSVSEYVPKNWRLFHTDYWGKKQHFIQKFPRIWCLKNVNFVKNETLKMWILSRMRLWKCEFCQKMRHWKCEFCQKMRFLKCEFLDKLKIFAPLRIGLG